MGLKDQRLNALDRHLALIGFMGAGKTTLAEAAVAWELAVLAKDKFGGDAVGDFVAAHAAYVERIQWR